MPNTASSTLSGKESVSSSQASSTGDVSALTEPSDFQFDGTVAKNKKKKKTAVPKKKTVLTVYLSRRDPVPMPDELIPLEKKNVVEVAEQMMDDKVLMEVIIPAHIMSNFEKENRLRDTILKDAMARVDDYRESIISLCSVEYDKEVASRAAVTKLHSDVVKAVSHKDVWDTIKAEKFNTLKEAIDRIGQVYYIPFKRNSTHWLKKAKTLWEQKYMVTLLSPTNDKADSAFNKLGMKTIRDKVRGKVNKFLLETWNSKILIQNIDGSVAFHIPNTEIDKGEPITLYALIGAKKHFVNLKESLHQGCEGSEGSGFSAVQDYGRIHELREQVKIGQLRASEYNLLVKTVCLIDLFFFPLNLYSS